jgi:NapC/NirT cytochrome c family, N-terminal region
MHYVGLLLFKADRGAKDFWGELMRRLRTEEEREKRRPQMAATVENFLNTQDSIMGRGCHTLEAFSCPRNAMMQLIHRDVIKADAVPCLKCYSGVDYVDEGANKSSGGWYMPPQARDGALLYRGPAPWVMALGGPRLSVNPSGKRGERGILPATANAAVPMSCVSIWLRRTDLDRELVDLARESSPWAWAFGPSTRLAWAGASK